MNVVNTELNRWLLDHACLGLSEWWASSQEKKIEQFTGKFLMIHLSVFSPGIWKLPRMETLDSCLHDTICPAFIIHISGDWIQKRSRDLTVWCVQFLSVPFCSISYLTFVFNCGWFPYILSFSGLISPRLSSPGSHLAMLCKGGHLVEACLQICHLLFCVWLNP